MKKKVIVILAVLIAIALLTAEAYYLRLIPWKSIDQEPRHHTIIEKLNSPVQLRELRADGLITKDGRVIHLRFVKNIPATNPIFAEATSHGIEIAAGGKVVGLIDIAILCGFSPIRRHLARIDLAALAIYLGAETTEDAPDFLRNVGRKTGETGWIGPCEYGEIMELAKKLDKAAKK